MTLLLDKAIKEPTTESPPIGLIQNLQWKSPKSRMSEQDMRDVAEADRRMNDPEQIPIDFEDAVHRMGK